MLGSILATLSRRRLETFLLELPISYKLSLAMGDWKRESVLVWVGWGFWMMGTIVLHWDYTQARGLRDV